MVKGMDVFKRYFSEYTDQYVLIGGVACDISFGDSGADFRATRDLDMVLIVEAQTKEFGQRFWKFIKDGHYRNRAKSSGEAQFYRFDKPEEVGYPSMIELFSRSAWIMEQDAVLTPIHIDDSVSSLSAILLNDAYYELLLRGRKVIDGISVLTPTYLIPFKAKAWLDLNEKLERGEHVDSRNLKKHRNDIIRISAELMLEPCELSETVKEDMKTFIEKLHVTDAELKNLKIAGVHEKDIEDVLKAVYLKLK
jgi:hypothetical protein